MESVNVFEAKNTEFSAWPSGGMVAGEPLAEWRTVTPMLAKEWLERGGNNRKLKTKHVATLARAIRDGRWRQNGCAIVLDEDGKLRDGQHRCAAIVSAARPIRALVVSGVDPEAFDTIDTGMSRKTRDVLQIHGEMYASWLAGALTAVWQDRRGIPLFTSTRPTPAEAFDTLEAEPALRAVPRRVEKTVKLLTPSVAIWAYWKFSALDPTLCERLFHGIATGENLTNSDPVYLFRERLIEDAAKRTRMRQMQIAAFLVKTWNMMRAGKTVKLLRWGSTEAFPTVE